MAAEIAIVLAMTPALIPESVRLAPDL